MATEQVLNWINNDLSLSQSIVNFETDFSNGYLLGEILASFDQVDLTTFNKKKNKEAKVNNFYLIEAALRKLNVKFDGKLIHQIMEEERGASLRLLYQIKLACQRLRSDANGLDEMTMSGLKNAQINKILQAKQGKTLEMSKSIPPPTVGGKDIRTAKQKRQDNRVIGFDVTQKQLFDNALQAHQAELEFIRSLTQEQRNTNMTKLTENQTFMKEWTKEGEQKWKLNQQRREEAMAKVKYFEDREVNIYKTRLANEQLAATQEQINGILDFDKNLQKQGIQQGISMEEAIKKQEEKKGIPPGQIQNFSYAATMNKIKETKKNSDFAGKERDRRRRKMIVDQQNAQTKLDLEASEEALIQKLLKQTNEEQKTALIDLRMNLCKQNDFETRKNAALSIEQKRKIQNQIAEEKRQANVKDIETVRAKQNEIKRQEVKKNAYLKKMEKRQVNIEIASGLVDLILDLADETYDVVSNDKQHQIQNPQWRQFISIFKLGRKVSLRNISNAQINANQNGDQEGLQIPEDTQAHEVQKLLFSDASLLKFYEYLSGSGAFNIPQLHPQLWHKYGEQYENADHDSSIPFIDIVMQQNGDLIKLIDQLYNQTQQNTGPVSKAQQNQILTQPTIKLSIVGPAFSGKKTIAKQMQEILGSDVAILHIDEIIKEAYDYISPKKQDESVIIDPKAKGKKVVEQVITDIFEGKNTVNYKSIAQQIKEQFFQGETLPRKIDLSDLVLDDALLNSLVIERLKLLTEGKPPKGPEAIKAGLVREREILKQLEELEANAAQAAADPKAKAKQHKGGPDPEKLNNELNEIRSFKASGWILIGYPKQLSQVKLLEQELTDFVAKIDQQKSERVEIRESWSKLMVGERDTDLYLMKQQTVQSGFDSIFFVETPSNECLKRAQGLNDESADKKRIQSVNEDFNSKVNSIKKWCEQFGLVDQNQKCIVTLNQSIVSQNWDKKEIVKEQALTCLKKIIDFKQVQFDQQRNEIKETIEQKSMEHIESTIQEKQTDLNAQSMLEINQSPDNSQRFHFNENSGILLEEHIDVKNKTMSSFDGTTNKSQRRQKLQRYELSDNQKINKWEEMLNSYYRHSMQRFHDLVQQRKRIFQLFRKTQSSFLDFICRDSPFQRRVNEFCDNFNRFSEQYPELRFKDETRTELTKRVQILNDNLWQTILERKTQAVAESESQIELMQNGWETREKSKLVRLVAQLMEYEFNRFRTIVQVVTGWVVNQDFDMGDLCSKLDERNTSTYEQGVSPMLEQVVAYLHSLIAQLLQDPCVTQQQSHQKTMILKEKSNFHLRCNTLKSYALLLLEEIDQNTQEIGKALDQWIIKSVKKENQVCQEVVKSLRLAVQSEETYLSNYTVQGVNLQTTIQKVKLDEGLPLYLTKANSSRSLADKQFKIDTLATIYDQLKSNAYEDLLDAQTFITLIIENYQSYRLPQGWRNLPFQAILDLINKFADYPLTNEQKNRNPFQSESTRTQYVDWRKIFLIFALSSSQLPGYDTLKTYGNDLAYYGQYVSLESFQDTDAWYDLTESATTPSQLLKASSSLQPEFGDDEVFDTQRLRQLKQLIWLTVKRTNEEGVRAQDLVKLITEIKQKAVGKTVFGDILA